MATKERCTAAFRGSFCSTCHSGFQNGQHRMPSVTYQDPSLQPHGEHRIKQRGEGLHGHGDCVGANSADAQDAQSAIHSHISTMPLRELSQTLRKRSGELQTNSPRLSSSPPTITLKVGTCSLWQHSTIII